MTFLSREDAGRKLGERLRENSVAPELVFGLPRGGVIVAAGVAQVLDRPLDVIVVRKIGHPRHREFAVGALAEGVVIVLDEEAIASTQVARDELEKVIAEEKDRLREYQLKFRRESSAQLAGKSVCVVDDGLATGATAEAAVLSVRKRAANQVVIAAPVASESAFARLGRSADEVIALLVDPMFDAVGRYYEKFEQTTDEEVIEILRRQNRAG